MDIRNFFSKKGPGAAASPAVQPPPSKKAPENKEDAKNEDSSTKRRRGAPEAKSSASGTSSLKPEAGKKTSTTQSKTTRLLIIDDEEDDIEKVKGGSRNGRPVVPISGIKVSSSMAEEEGGIRPKRGLAPSVAPSNGTVEPNNNTKKKKPKHVHDEDIFLDDSDDDFETSRPTFKNLPDSSNWVAQTKKAGQPAATPNAKQESPLRLRSSPRLQSPASTAPLLGSTSTSSTRARPSIASNSKPIQKKNTASASAASITALPRPAVGAVQPRNAFDVDSAAPQCLVGCTFCFTGIMTDLPSRDDAVELIKVLGGRVTGNVSGKTDYLVLGQVLEDGRSTEEGSKYKRAVTESNVALINGAFELYGLLQYYSDAKHKNCTNSKNGIDDGKRSAMNTSTNSTAVKPNDVNTTTNVPAPVPQNPYAMTVAANPYAKTANTSLQRTGGNPYASKPSATTSASNTKPDKKVKMPFRETGPKINVLWVDKYKPVRSSEILGNQDAVRKLSVWLNTWEDRFISNSTVKSFSSPNGPWKAALLSGPPGIGKTTTATLVAQESGRDVIEFNASDVRSKKAFKEEMGDITGSQTLEFRKVSLKGPSTRQKRCVIMDEVDGMGAGDRSGMAELIQMIKGSRVPIICICNDRQSQKMKSLLPYCMDLRYRRPVKSVIASRAVQVAQLEGLSVEQNAAEAIVESCGNDVRQVLNCLQMWSSNTKSNTMTYKNLKDRERSINKDEILRVSLFDAARVIVEGRKGLTGADKNAERSHFFHRNDAFYVDYNLVGLLVQQNYIKLLMPQFNEMKRQNDLSKLLNVLDRTHDAAQSMSDWAVLDGSLHSDMNWSLLPATAALAVKTGYHAGGESGGVLPGFPEFSTWLGRNSSRGKKIRIMSELNYHMNYKISASTSEMRMSYLPLLRDLLLSLLNRNDDQAVESAIEIMDEYGLDRDDVFEKLDEFNLVGDSSKSGGFQKIDSKRKAAFTRLYNQGSHKSQALVAEQGGAKKVKRKATTSSDTGDPDAIDDDNVDDEEEENDDDDEIDAEKIKAMFQKKRRGKASTATKKADGAEKTASKPRAKAKPKAAPKKK